MVLLLILSQPDLHLPLPDLSWVAHLVALVLFFGVVGLVSYVWTLLLSK